MYWHLLYSLTKVSIHATRGLHGGTTGTDRLDPPDPGGRARPEVRHRGRPVVQGGHIAVRGVPKAVTPGIPGATAPVAFTGTGVLGVLEGRLAEYWVGSDMHVLSAQLQVTGG